MSLQAPCLQLGGFPLGRVEVAALGASCRRRSTMARPGRAGHDVGGGELHQSWRGGGGDVGLGEDGDGGLGDELVGWRGVGWLVGWLVGYSNAKRGYGVSDARTVRVRSVSVVIAHFLALISPPQRP